MPDKKVVRKFQEGDIVRLKVAPYARNIFVYRKYQQGYAWLDIMDTLLYYKDVSGGWFEDTNIIYLGNLLEL